MAPLPPREDPFLGKSSHALGKCAAQLNCGTGLASPGLLRRKEGRVARVLVVEDDAWMAWMIADDLAERGYQVSTARDGAEALRRLKATRPSRWRSSSATRWASRPMTGRLATSPLSPVLTQLSGGTDP
jgi:hypothetical protein